MIAQAALPFAVALAIATPVPSPVASATIAPPNPSPSPIAMPILAGITLEERAAGVLLREGVHSQGPTGGGLEFAVWRGEFEDIIIGIAFDQKVREIVVSGSSDPHSHYADPYGIRLGEALEHLLTVRGHPDDVHDIDTGGDESIRYGPENGVHWTFVVFGNKVDQIVLSDGS